MHLMLSGSDFSCHVTLVNSATFPSHLLFRRREDPVLGIVSRTGDVGPYAAVVNADEESLHALAVVAQGP